MASVTIPSTPDPTKQQQILFVIKLVLKILGALGIAWGSAVTTEQWAAIAGALAMLGEFGLSWWQKNHQAFLDHAGNIASARAGTATKVVAVKGSLTDVLTP